MLQPSGSTCWMMTQQQNRCRARLQAHPPAAGGQPLPSLLQHQAFLATDQPAIQLAKPALQSYGLDDVTQPPPWFGQPLPWTLQHHSFFGTDQPACQFAKPSAQLYGSAGATGWWFRQHHAFLSAAHVFSGSTAQLKGSTGPLGAGGLVGGWVGGGLGGGVGG